MTEALSVRQVLECDRSKISRIETGQRGIRPKELRELLTEYSVNTATQDTLIAIARPPNGNGWQEDYRSVLPGAYRDFSVAEGVASRISVYAPLQVPELLWTPDYGKAVAAADPTVPEGVQHAAVEAAIACRGARHLDRHPDCTVIIGEAALRHQAGTPDAMRAQLARVAELSGPEYPWLTIRITPFSAGPPAAGGSGGYTILCFDETPGLGLVHLSGPRGGICLSEPSHIAAYTTVFAQAASISLSPQQSAIKLRQLTPRKRRGSEPRHRTRP